MSISRSELRVDLFRASGDTPVERAKQTLEQQERPTGWTVLVDLGAGSYGVLTLFDLSDALAQRLTAEPDLRLREILQPSPNADAERETIATLRQRSSPTGYVVVLRDNEPIGVLMLKRGRAGLLTASTTGTANPADSLRQVPQRTDRYVNTDIAEYATPEQPLDRVVPLAVGTQYYFRLRVGELEQSSIEAAPGQLPPELLDRTVELDVVLFSEDFAIEADRGRLQVPVRGLTSVLTPASIPDGMDERTPLVVERLLFAIRAPEHSGVASLRCSIYYHGMLIQSRLIRAVVGAAPPLDETGVLRRSVMDYNLSTSLQPQVLAQVEPHRLSLMLNSTGADGTHSFRVVAGDGKDLFAGSATLSENALANLIELGRERLRQAAWGKTSEWDGEEYRYEPKHGADELGRRLREDLIGLARRGALLYNDAIKDLTGGAGARELRALMRTPGLVQLASKHNANDIAPIALFYDYRIDTQASELTLCPGFEQSLASGRPLIDELCFKGECPSNGDLTIVCPSGFWGYRHDIGMPYPVRPRGPELATRISYSGEPRLDIAYFSDFPQAATHLDRLVGLGYQSTRVSPRGEVLKLMLQSKPQVFYFYCHGVEVNSIPFLRVGGQDGQDYLSTDNVANYEIGWPDTRPLVFINGCHTNALTPNKAIGFVEAFVDDACAAGVIGTEITIFEPLAQRFAETFLKLFADGIPLGRAVRMARLELLAMQNPLGLAYLPLAYAGLKMERKP